MIQYEIPFRTIDGRAAVVQIESDTWSASPLTLTGTADPITTSLDDSPDLFTPVRRSTGYIRIVDDGSAPDIVPTGTKERRVTLTVDGSLMWRGWLKAESYKSSWDYLPTLEIPIQSGLGVLDNITLLQDDVTLSTGQTMPATYRTVRIARLILECVHLMGTDITDIVFPATVASTDGWGALGLRVSRWNWFKRNADQNFDDADWKPLEARTAMDVLTDICTFFGWTCEEWHGVLYFVEVGATDYAAVTYAQLANYALEVSVPEPYPATIPDALSLASDYSVSGASNTIEHMQPARKVTVTATSEAVSDIVSIHDSDLELIRYVYNEWPSHDSVTKYYVSRNPLFEMHKYIRVDGVWTEVPYSDTRTFDGAGGLAAAYDYHHIDEANHPTNFDLRTGVYLEKTAWDGSAWVSPTDEEALSMPAVVFHSPGVANFSDGYLCISATAKSSMRSDSATPSHTRNGRGRVRAQLRIGGRFWYDSVREWRSAPSYFDIIVVPSEGAASTTADGEGRVVNQKTLKIDCESCSGMIIPITEHMSGDVTLTIPTLVQTVDGTSGDYDELAIVDFRVTYHPPISRYYEDGDDRSYTTFTGADGDAVEVSVGIASSNNSRPGYGLLMDGSNVPITQLAYSDNSEQRPELRLIDRMCSHYASVRDKITVDVDNYQADGATVPNTDNPLTVVAHGGKSFAIIGREVHWRDWTQTLTLLEI